MPFDLILAVKARAVLDALEDRHVRAIFAHIERLAASPAGMSRPTPSFPFKSDYGMMTEFTAPARGRDLRAFHHLLQLFPG